MAFCGGWRTHIIFGRAVIEASHIKPKASQTLDKGSEGTDQRRFCAQFRRGITIMELLVVIGIITVIMAILLPVISKSRKASHSLTCLSNLRQIGNAFKMYAADNRGILPPSRDVAGQ